MHVEQLLHPRLRATRIRRIRDGVAAIVEGKEVRAVLKQLFAHPRVFEEDSVKEGRPAGIRI